MTAIDSPILLPPDAPAAPSVRVEPRTVRNSDWIPRPLVGRATGPLLTAVAGYLTCGLLPLWGWLWQWHRVIRQDRRADRSTDDGRSLLLAAPRFFAVLLTAELVWMLTRGFAPQQIREALLGHGLLLRFYHPARFVPLRLPTLWNDALLIAYGCYWGAVRTHVGRQTLNAGVPRLATGLSSLWIVGAVFFGMEHLWWGIPLMLAGAQQREYLTRTRQRWVPMPQPSAAPLVPTPRTQTSVCTTTHCAASLPESAHYCPRCGTARA